MPSGAIPLLRWDTTCLSVSLDRINHQLAELISDVDEMEQLVLVGAGDHLRFTATVRYRGMRLPLALEARETRLRHRRVGFRIVHLRTLAHVTVPLMVVARVLDRLLGQRHRFDRVSRIVLIDLRDWLPPEVELAVAEIRVRGRFLVLELEPGRLWDIPGRLQRARESPAESPARSSAPVSEAVGPVATAIDAAAAASQPPASCDGADDEARASDRGDPADRPA
jgi:hypothetical protein